LKRIFGLQAMMGILGGWFITELRLNVNFIVEILMRFRVHWQTWKNNLVSGAGALRIWTVSFTVFFAVDVQQ